MCAIASPAVGIDLHKINTFTAQSGWADDAGGWLQDLEPRDRLPDPNMPPPPEPSVRVDPPLFEPGSVIPEGFGGNPFDAPGLTPLALPPPPPDWGLGEAYPIPEPTTAALLTLGAALALRRRR